MDSPDKRILSYVKNHPDWIQLFRYLSEPTKNTFRRIEKSQYESQLPSKFDQLVWRYFYFEEENERERTTQYLRGPISFRAMYSSERNQIINLFSDGFGHTNTYGDCYSSETIDSYLQKIFTMSPYQSTLINEDSGASDPMIDWDQNESKRDPSKPIYDMYNNFLRRMHTLRLSNTINPLFTYLNFDKRRELFYSLESVNLIALLTIFHRLFLLIKFPGMYDSEARLLIIAFKAEPRLSKIDDIVKKYDSNPSQFGIDAIEQYFDTYGINDLLPTANKYLTYQKDLMLAESKTYYTKYLLPLYHYLHIADYEDLLCVPILFSDFMIISDISDLYALALATQPQTSNNIVIYAGGFHTNHMYKLLFEMDYVVINKGQPAPEAKQCLYVPEGLNLFLRPIEYEKIILEEIMKN